MIGKAVVVLAIFFVVAEAAPRIVNGTDARPGEFPYAVSLRRNLRHTCGGTIINARHVLTAAHCICNGNQPQDATQFTIQYGSVDISQDNQRSVQIQKITCGEFDSVSLENDVAVLRLATALPDDGTWEAVTLAESFDASVRHTGVIIGWGRLWDNGPLPETLQKLEVTTYTEQVCGVRFNPFHHICFGAVIGSACNGDSGTALIVDGVQVGIASFISTTCGTANALFPNVYANLASYKEFILDNSRY